MKVTDKVLEVVQDHTRITDTIDSICCAIGNGTEMQNFIPVCNDTMVSDQLGKICETITELRKNQK